MSLIILKNGGSLLSVGRYGGYLSSVRNRTTRPNIQRPRHPVWDRKKLLELTAPQYPEPHPTTEDLWRDCPQKNRRKNLKLKQEPNELEKLYGEQMRELVYNSEMFGFFHQNRHPKEQAHKMWQNARRQGMEMKNYNRKICRAALENSPFENALHFVDTGPSKQLLFFSPKFNPEGLLFMDKKHSEIMLIGAVVYNRILSREQLIELSKSSLTLEGARGELVSILGSPAAQTSSLLASGAARISQSLEQYIKDQSQK